MHASKGRRRGEIQAAKARLEAEAKTAADAVNTLEHTLRGNGLPSLEHSLSGLYVQHGSRVPAASGGPL